MAKDNFYAVMDHVFREEGGYADHPKDPGGATNMGITHHTLSDWRGKPVSKVDVRNLTKAEAVQIYKRNYWDKINGDALPYGLDLLTMDAAVNSGTGRGPKWTQAALGVAQDGKIGPKTLEAARKADLPAVINRAMDVRLSFLEGLDTWPTFGRGWKARVARVRKEALKMAASHPKPEPVTPRPQPDPVAPTPQPEPTAPARNVPWFIWLILAIVVAAIVYFIPR